jgi:hypothetical protein
MNGKRIVPAVTDTDTDTDTPASPPTRIGALTNAIVSASATLIALVALATGIYQAKLSRDQANAAVWPFLLQGNAWNTGYSRIIQNVGIGPARVGAFEIRVHDKPVHSWREVAESLHIQPSWRGVRRTTIRAGIVIPANTVTDVLDLPDSGDAKIMRAALSANASMLDTWICYCSIYDKCWAGKGSDSGPTEVKSCHDDPARAFR